MRALREYVEAQDYAGYDPYDALNSPLLKLLSRRSKILRMAFTQVVRRSPVNLRPLLGVKKGHNPKGIGLFLWGYTKLFEIDKDEQHLRKIEYLLDLLEALKSHDCSGNGWGYNFDWQQRAFFRPKGVPTVVNTAFIGHALLDCYLSTGSQRALDLAIPIKNFILQDLNRTREGDSFCFSYTPVDTDVVHNANMLGASILIRLLKYSPDSLCEDAALSSLAYSMRYQHDDGFWYYGNSWKYKWIDSFHTGFNLEALRYFLDDDFGQEYRQAYEKGVKYYSDNFFLEDGTPKYYHNRTYPIDIHSSAQAICFFCREGEKYQELADKVLNWMLRNMYSDKGYFYFRKGKFLTNRISYMRWSQAWVFHALTEYLCAATENIEKVKRTKAKTATDFTD